MACRSKVLYLLIACAALTVQVAFAQLPTSKHVYIVAEENHSYKHLVGSKNMPYLNSLLVNGGIATQFYANQHRSLPNYFWLTAGQHITNNEQTTAAYDVDNIVRQILSLGLTYKSYAQSLPRPGFAGLYSGAYMKRHAPLPYFVDMANSPAEMLKHVSTNQLLADINNGQLPNFGFITPDANHDMHNCPAGEAACERNADEFLQTYIAPLLASPAFQPGGDGLLVIWGDEADLNTDNACSASALSGCGGHVLVALIGPRVKKGFRSITTYHHPDLLRTVLTMLGDKSSFPGTAGKAQVMDEFFRPR